MFIVLDNGKRADFIGIDLPTIQWAHAIYENSEDAVYHAKVWLGDYFPNGLVIDEPMNYTDDGDTIEIRNLPWLKGWYK